MNIKGFSLVEVMIATAIASVAIGVISANFGSLKRLSDSFNYQVAYNEQMLIFLLKFEEDYHQSDLSNQDDQEGIKNLVFKLDHNFDGDYLDSGETISYRWNAENSRIDRKSGKGYFQSFLEGITSFSWTEISESPLCHEMIVKDVFKNLSKKIRFCRFSHFNG